MQTSDEKSKVLEKGRTRNEIWLVLLHGLAIVVLGIGLFPMMGFLIAVKRLVGGEALWVKALAFSFALPVGYFIFGTALIFSCILVKNIFGFKIKPGLYPLYSHEARQWAGYNSLILIANSAFLDVLRVSFFQTLFYRLMGAKVGKGLNVNTGGLADLSLLEIGDNVLIGGGVALICHGFERSFVRLAPTRLADNVSIGLNTVIMPDCQIGEGASIAPCSFLPKGTRIPARGHWGGNPVRDLRAERRQALESES